MRGPTPFKELVRLLNEHRVTAVPVLDDAGRLVVGVDSRLTWKVHDVDVQPVPPEPAPLM